MNWIQNVEVQNKKTCFGFCELVSSLGEKNTHFIVLLLVQSIQFISLPSEMTHCSLTFLSAFFFKKKKKIISQSSSVCKNMKQAELKLLSHVYDDVSTDSFGK